MHLPPFLYDVTIPALEYHRRMLDWCRVMRTDHPVMYDDDHHMWMVFRYSDGILVRRDYLTFSSANMIPAEHDFKSLTNMDPPQHQKMRALITQAFTPRAMTSLSPRVESIVGELLDQVLPFGEMDWVADLAVPLPLQVIAQILGLPRENWIHYKSWTDAIVNQTSEMPEAGRSFYMEFSKAIEVHRQQEQDDILGMLIAAEVDGERLSFNELIGFCFTLFVAGYITTTNALGNAVLCFYREPASFEQLRCNPELLPSAIEEILRYMPPFRASPNDLIEGRTATKDVMIASQLIRAGERIQVNRVSVNFDDEQIANPEHFDITRSPNHHQSFGHGIHYCIGASLARMEMTTALAAMVERLRDVRVLNDEPIEQADSRIMFGPKRLPLVFERAQ